MPRISDADLANHLDERKDEARHIEHEAYAKATANDCHENALSYCSEHPGCTAIRGWLIENFVGWNYFIAHTVVQRPNGFWIDPTPMDGQYLFLRHDGDEEDFAIQRHNRPRVQYFSMDEINLYYELPAEEPEEH